MNKKYIILLLLMLIIPFTKVGASNNKVEIISGNEYVYCNENFKIDIAINSDDLLNNIDGILEYDKTKLELIEIDTYRGITCSFNDKISCTTKDGVTNGNLFYAIFKPKNALKVDQNVIINFKKININDGTYEQEDVSKTFKVLKDKVNVDATLRVLTVNNTSVLDTKTYTTTRDNITIYGIANSDSTTIIGLGNKTLKIGENIFNVVGISESGLKKAYVIKIYRKELPSEEYKEEIEQAEEKTNSFINEKGNVSVNNSSNSQSNNSSNITSSGNNDLNKEQLLLTNIVIDEYALDFNPYKFIYRFSVSPNVSSLSIKAFADKDIDVVVENNEQLAFGENIIIINLKKNDETNKYILYVTREEQKKSNSNEMDNSVKRSSNSDNNGITNYILIILIIVLLAFALVFLLVKRKKTKTNNYKY